MESEQERANALAREGLDAMNAGNPANARKLFEESKAIREAIGDRVGVGKALNNLANVSAQEGDEAGAMALWRQSLELQRALNYLPGMHSPIANMSSMAYRQGNFVLMRDLDEQMVALARAIDDSGFLASSLDSLTQTALYGQDVPYARQVQRESLAIKRECDIRVGLPTSLQLCADIASAMEDFAQAAVFYGAYVKQRSLLDEPGHPQEKEQIVAAIAALESTLGEAAYRSAYSTGKLMTPEQALNAAIEFCTVPAA